MKFLLLIAIILNIVSCKSDGNKEFENNNSNIQGDTKEESNVLVTNLLESNVSGTWLYLEEKRRIRIDTGEYISSQFYESKVIMEDTENGVRYDECWGYNQGYSPYAVKTEEHLYMSPNDSSDVGFIYLNENTLIKTKNYEEEWEEGFTFESIYQLKRISDGIEIDNGTFILNGPISIEEYDHTCTWKIRSNVGISHTLVFFAPYDDKSVRYRFRLEGSVPVGSYYIEDYWDSGIIGFDIHSSASLFWDIVGSNLLAASDVTLNITESTSDVLAGNFSLLGQDSQRYSGEFEIDLTN